MREVGKSSHLSRKRPDVRIITESEQAKCGEGANAERHTAELILGQVEGANGWSNDIEWQAIELIIGEIKNCEVRGPLCYNGDLGKPVVGEIEHFQAWKLKKTFWDCDQLIVLEINLYNLQKFW